MKSILSQAEHMESKLNSRLSQLKNPYKLKYSSVWVLTPSLQLKRVAKAGDVYELLEDRKTLTAIGNADTFSVVTCGWAAPLADVDQVAPSQHPERRRVRLVVTATNSGVASVLRFQDKPNEKTTDEGTARGSLADAIQNLMQEVVAHQQKSGE